MIKMAYIKIKCSFWFEPGHKIVYKICITYQTQNWKGCITVPLSVVGFRLFNSLKPLKALFIREKVIFFCQKIFKLQFKLKCTLKHEMLNVYT